MIKTRVQVLPLLAFTFVGLLTYGLYDFNKENLNDGLSLTEKSLKNFQYYTFTSAFFTYIHGLLFYFGVIFSIFPPLTIFSEILFKLTDFTDVIFLSINSIIFIIFWPLYFFKRTLIMGLKLAENPNYFLDSVMHLCPLFISSCIVNIRDDYSMESKKYWFALRCVFLSVINITYLFILLKSNKLFNRFPYPILKDLSTSFICGGIALVFVIEIFVMYLICVIKRQNKVKNIINKK